MFCRLRVRIVSILFAVLTLVVFSSIGDFASISFESQAAGTYYLFDLGATSQSGYTSVSASDAYSSSVGYGFRDTSAVTNVTASGSGALSDAVRFDDVAGNTFDVDLPNGLYQITVTLGDTNRTSVYMEEMMQIVNMTGNNATDSILLPITDGQLNIRAAAGKEGYYFTISTIEIEYVSDATILPSTVWICGDSTVCNYYPLETSEQAGWGQVLGEYIDTSVWNIRDMAASGQYAKGFVDAGQFDAIETYGKTGDIYIISIGINDTNYSNETEYYETVTDMTLRAQAKGMTVFLVKQQGRASDVTNNPNLTGRWFGSTLDQIGEEQGVEVIDLFNMFHDYCMSIGQEATTALYMDGDDLHPNREGAKVLASMVASQIDWDNPSGSADTFEEGANIEENTLYMIRNKNSGLYLTVEDGLATDGANVSQQVSPQLSEEYLWTVKADDDGYYYIYSALAGGETYLLDLYYGNAENGTNIGIWGFTDADAQLFKFVDNGDGSYLIVTKSSRDKSCVEIINAYTNAGANVQEWERNGNDCQAWYLDPVTLSDIDSDIILGDTSGDGEVNAIDLTQMRQEVMTPYLNHKAKWYGDTNADGALNLADIALMQRYTVPGESFEATNSRRIYYASDASWCQGVSENVNTGYTDEFYVNLDNCTGSFLEWTVYAPVAGNYLCSFRIANASANNRQMKIEVNGAADYWVQDFLTTGDWTTWSSRGIVLPLTAGENTIRMTSMTSEGGPNIDTLIIECTEEPIAEVYVPSEDNSGDITDEGTMTIYIAGDSTVQTYRESYAPQQGWGAYLQDYLSEDYVVSNQAIAGRSSKSFYDNGRLDTILDTIQEGDYLLVQFAINDSDYTNEERYAPVCGNVPGSEGSYEYYMAKYIEGALEKGATPVLVTTTIGLKAYNSTTGLFENTYTEYCDACKNLAAYYGIDCIDLNSLMVDHYNAIGYDTAYTYHLISTDLSETDMTHFTETGAYAVAGLVAGELNKILP